MAVKAWFNYSTYMANKLVQMQETYPDENWTSAKLNAAFEKAGFVGDAGAQAHFQKYGHTEDVSPNKYFDAKYYYESKAIKYYTEQVAESQRMTKDEVLKDLDTYAKNMEGAIKAAHMDAWTHYIKYGTAEGVNPSNSFSTSNYMADKLAALQAADPSAGWTEESMNAAFKKAGLNALEHFMEYAGKSESEVSSTDIATYVVPDDQQIDDGSTTGDTFTLTTGIDDLEGTSGNDTFVGDQSVNNRTVQVGDKLDGADGTDTFEYHAAAATPVLPQMVSIEKMVFNKPDETVITLDTSSIEGLEEVTFKGGTGAVGAAATTIVSKDQTLGFDNWTGGGAVAFTVKDNGDTANLSFANGSALGATVITSTGLKTINLESTGSKANTVASITNNTAKNLVVTGDQALTIRDALANTITSVDTSAMTEGGLTVQTDATNLAYNGGAGADKVTLTAALDAKSSINLGDGNDSLTYTGAGKLGTQGADGGDGEDSIVAAMITVGTEATIKNFEILDLTGFNTALDIELMTNSTISKTVLGGTAGTSNTATLINLPSSTALEVTGYIDQATVATANLGAITLNHKTGATSTSDSLDLTFNANPTAAQTQGGNYASVGALKVNGTETINITSGGGDKLDGNYIASITDSENQLSTITITGEKAMTIAAIATDDVVPTTTTASSLKTIDASGMTTSNDNAGLSLTFDGSSLTNLTYKDLSIKGGSGQDTITFKNIGGTIEGGAGNDSITIQDVAGKSNIITVKGGDGNDTVTSALKYQATGDGTATDGSYVVFSDASKGDSIAFASVASLAKADVSAARSLDGAVAAVVDHAANNAAEWFEYGGNTYIVDDVDGTAANALVVQLIGTDLGLESATVATGTITLA